MDTDHNKLTDYTDASFLEYEQDNYPVVYNNNIHSVKQWAVHVLQGEWWWLILYIWSSQLN